MLYRNIIAILTLFQEIFVSLDRIEAEQQAQRKLLEQIILEVTPPPPSKLILTLGTPEPQ